MNTRRVAAIILLGTLLLIVAPLIEADTPLPVVPKTCTTATTSTATLSTPQRMLRQWVSSIPAGSRARSSMIDLRPGTTGADGWYKLEVGIKAGAGNDTTNVYENVTLDFGSTSVVQHRLVVDWWNHTVSMLDADTSLIANATFAGTAYSELPDGAALYIQRRDTIDGATVGFGRSTSCQTYTGSLTACTTSVGSCSYVNDTAIVLRSQGGGTTNMTTWAWFLNVTGDSPAIPAPTLTGTAGNAQVALSWNSVTNAQYYNVFYSTSSHSGALPLNVSYTYFGTTASTSTIVQPLTNGVTYYFRVQGANSALEGDASNELVAQPYLQQTNITANLLANCAVNLTWTPIGNTTFYLVNRSIISMPLITVDNATAPRNYSLQTGLSSGTTFRWAVTASNGATWSPESEIVYAALDKCTTTLGSGGGLFGGGSRVGGDGSSASTGRAAIANVLEVSEGSVDLLMASTLILLCAGAVFFLTAGNTYGAFAGATLGLFLDIGFGLLPLWAIVFIVVGSAALALLVLRFRGEGP